ncbi:hypothetical protein FQR65_LT08924 [Abscondita terminalis]|nr:hypothetical protein FQR65_LT08924 [Abscondita terminalis]
MYNFFKLIIIITLWCAKFNSAIIRVEPELVPFKNCLDHVIENIFQENETLSFMNIEDDVNLLDIVTNPYFAINLTKTVTKPGTYKFDNYNFVVHRTTNNIHNFFSRLYDSVFWSGLNMINSKFIIVAPTKSVESIFIECWRLGFVNVVVIAYCSYKKNCTENVFTANPQDYENDCGNKPIKFQTHSCSSKNTITFPNILRKYRNCNVSLVNALKLVNVNSKRSIIYSMFKKVITFLNATETFKDDLNDRFCFTESNLGLYPKYPKTCIVQRDDTVWVVPSPRKIPPIEVLKLIFDQYVWGAILLYFFLCRTDCVVDYVVWVCKQVPECLALKVMFIVYVVYSVHIQTGFTSDLVDILTAAQYEKGITTLEELSDSDMPIFIPDTFMYRSYFNDDNSTKTIYNKIRKKATFVQNISEIVFALNNSFSYVFQQDTVQRVQIVLKIKLNTFIDNSLIGDYKTVLRTRPGSYFVNSFDKVFNILIETGFEDNLNKVRENENKKKFYETFRVYNDNVVLTLHHVIAIFVLWICGVLISIVVFAAEWFVAYYV